MESIEQLSLQLFDPPTFESRLQKRGADRLLAVVVNRRLKRGWQVKVRPLSGKRQLVIPAYLDNAPGEIKNHLIDWALLPLRPKRSAKKACREQRALLEKKIWQYIESLPQVSASRIRVSRFNPADLSGKSRGAVYDLAEVFDSVNRAYFNGALQAIVRWGKPRATTSYHMTKTDTNGNRHNLITIAGVYNHPEVPRFAIEAIMHHEMLHIAVPPYHTSGRRVVHGHEFKKEEKKFAAYREWRVWEKNTLPALARKMRRSQQTMQGVRGLYKRLFTGTP